jgi:hypothetical protein
MIMNVWRCKNVYTDNVYELNPSSNANGIKLEIPTIQSKESEELIIAL